ncbi:hypothetical protein [Clostridium butyricum]|uniref:Uncharacterized protein n=1 Tax=Clostridium butyricum E4 str. BoNT E BL5262 TaxID=632245 RepID=C4IGS4_CLOBU|nr:hypothetical protein [Clostridium butyricum]EDT74809.1 hypothetical protein CBY_2555 [Clostridium butyricum 5521]EEP53450.1 hypothetical protein CLP_2618 [Clostridium butyricum E4 str. BoNT E BL5262]NFL30492.1 hypothetical protein [Clostridium butyricum]NFS19447.1 hypothetical protein [Clostridium butyricum]
MKRIIKNIKNIVSSKYFKIEMLFLLGIFIFTLTNFKLNIYFGLYTVSFLLIAYSIFCFYFDEKGDKKD